MVKAEVNGTLTYVIWMGCWTSMSLNSTWMEQWSWLSYCSWAVNSIKSYYCTKLIFTELGLSCDVKLTLRKHLQYVKLTLWSLEDLYTDWDRRMIVNGFDCWGSRGSRVPVCLCPPFSLMFVYCWHHVCLGSDTSVSFFQLIRSWCFVGQQYFYHVKQFVFLC